MHQPGEVTGLGSARTFAAAMHAALAGQSNATTQFVTSIQAQGTGGDAIAAAQAAQQASEVAAAAWARVDSTLAEHTAVGEAYAANPGAGSKEFITMDRPGSAADVAPASPAPPRDAPPAQAAADPDDSDAGPTDRDPDDDLDDDPVYRRAVAQFDIVSPLAVLARNAEAMLDNFDNDEDGDDDPEQLLRQLVRQVRDLGQTVGLGPVAQSGEVVAYDPRRHWQLGDEPPPGATVKVREPGQQWQHGGPNPHVFTRAFTVFTDDEHGDYIVTGPSSLDEEPEDEQNIWVDLPDVDATVDETGEYDPDDHPEDRHRVPTAYEGPGWYHVAAVEECAGGEEHGSDGPAEGCDGYVLSFDPWQGDEYDRIHYPADARILLSYNE